MSTEATDTGGISMAVDGDVVVVGSIRAPGAVSIDTNLTIDALQAEARFLSISVAALSARIDFLSRLG